MCLSQAAPSVCVPQEFVLSSGHDLCHCQAHLTKVKGNLYQVALTGSANDHTYHSSKARPGGWLCQGIHPLGLRGTGSYCLMLWEAGALQKARALNHFPRSTVLHHPPISISP